MLTQTDGKIDGVLAANDGLGNAAITVLKKQQAQRQGPGDRPGRDRAGPAEHPRRRPVHDRLQGRSRRRPTRPPTLAIALAKGEKPTTPARPSRTRRRGKDVPSVLLTPQAITKDNVKDVVADGYVTKAELCTGGFADAVHRRRASADPTGRVPAARRRRPARTPSRCRAALVRRAPTELR